MHLHCPEEKKVVKNEFCYDKKTANYIANFWKQYGAHIKNEILNQNSNLQKKNPEKVSSWDG